MDETRTIERTAGSERASAAPAFHTAHAPKGSLQVLSECGTFVCAQVAWRSSLRKQVVNGVFLDAEGTAHPAVAAIFAPDSARFYGAEAAALARNGLIDVGPDVYDYASRCIVDGRECPVIIEEDAGISLENAIFNRADIPDADDISTAAARTEAYTRASRAAEAHPADARALPEQNGTFSSPLHDTGTALRTAENAKIAFDLLSQVRNLHEAGLYHRDIRPANVCVRRFGPDPADIHATLIDHELCTSARLSVVPAASAAYERAVFDEIPRKKNAGYVFCEPNSLLRDLGYLAALLYELESGRRISNAGPSDIAQGALPFFAYAESGTPICHTLDIAADIAPLARQLQLDRVDSARIPNPVLRSRICAAIRHAGFLDARDMRRIGTWIDANFEHRIEDIARFGVYRQWREQCEQVGRTPEYADFDSQPDFLRESNLNQARDMLGKIRQIGCSVVARDSIGNRQVVDAFEDEEVEYLALCEHRRWMEERKQLGWICGSPRDDARRIHPDLKPYEDLTEEVKDYDRAAVRAIPGILARCGLAVVRGIGMQDTRSA